MRSWLQSQKWSQIIEHTVGPACLSEKLIPKHNVLLSLAQIIQLTEELIRGHKGKVVGVQSRHMGQASCNYRRHIPYKFAAVHYCANSASFS